MTIPKMKMKRVFQPTIGGKIEHEHVDAWVEYSISAFEEKAEELAEALDRNSKSSGFLARVGIAVAVVGTIVSGIGVWYTYLSYIR